jgi:hypothetical protein
VFQRQKQNLAAGNQPAPSLTGPTTIPLFTVKIISFVFLFNGPPLRREEGLVFLSTCPRISSSTVDHSIPTGTKEEIYALYALYTERQIYVIF